MSLWRHLSRGLWVLARRDAADRQLADELQHYADEAVAALVAEGVPPDEARRRVRREIGSTLTVREQVRAGAWEDAVDATLADIRYAWRRFAASPGFTAVAVATAAIGIGATTAIFSVVNPILLQPLPYPQANRIVSIADRAGDGSSVDVTFGTFREVLARSRTLAEVSVLRPWQPTMTTDAAPERLDGQRVTASYFAVLGIRPAMGRDFDPADDLAGGPNVVVLADGLWRRRFGGDPTIVGRVVRLNGAAYTIVGVMPRGFENVLAPSADVWAPLQYDTALPRDGREWGHHLQMVARLRAGAGLAAARQDLQAIAQHPLSGFPRVPWATLEQGFVTRSLQDEVTRGIRPALVAIAAAVLLVLGTACANVTNLLLARGARRRGELAMRAALGAGRSRLVRQLVTESVLLAVAGGAAGIAVAEAGVRLLVSLSPPGLPRVGAIRVDAVALGFAFAVSALVGLVVSAAPALQASRQDVRSAVPHGARQTAGPHRRLRGALVVAEMALALVLLVSAGLLLRSLQRLFAVDPGFNSTNAVSLRVQMAGIQYDDAAVGRFVDRTLEAVGRQPGVEAAGFTSQLPLSGDLDRYGAQLESAIAADSHADQGALRYAVTPGYFAAMGMPLRRGRLLDSRDRAGAPVAVVVSESFVRHRFGGRDPIGQRLHLGRTDVPWYTIVGVVGDVKQTSLAVDDGDAVYIPEAQWYSADRVLSLVVRARTEPAPTMAALRNAIWTIDKDLPIVRAATLADMVAASAAERRFALLIFECFALVALALAATGIYGVLSGSVAERLREIGVRAALGASRGSLLTLVLAEGMALSAIGIALGAAAAAAASRAAAAMLFEISPLDVPTYAAVAALLVAVSAIACWAPAWRASRVDPSVMLRAE